MAIGSSVTRKTLKFVLIGPHSCGKSSLNRRYLDDCFTPSLTATIGYVVSFKKFNKGLGILIWDTGAAENARQT